MTDGGNGGDGNGADGGSAPSTPADPWYVAGAYAFVVIGMLLGWGIWKAVKPHGFVPTAGVSVFAVLYIFAQSIERVVEPLSSFLNAASPKVNKTAALQALADDPSNRENHAGLAQVRRNRGVILWAIASFLAMLAAGGLGVFLLHDVGLSSAPPIVDILITGLAIGSGSKPLHDLIQNLQKNSASKDASAVGG